MARIKRGLSVDGRARACAICYKKDGVVNESPDLDLGYVLSFWDGNSTDTSCSPSGLIGLASTLYNNFLPYLWVDIFHHLSALADTNLQSSQPRGKVSRRDVLHHLPQRQCSELI